MAKLFQQRWEVMFSATPPPKLTASKWKERKLKLTSKKWQCPGKLNIVEIVREKGMRDRG